ncbi:MAG TPA: ECF-type sigma factor [Longimicrobiales bacterium]|nr:ECF-type sigma factor [Longimicrobiales bacterium]
MTTPAEPSQITELLRRWSEGETDALDQVLPLLYEQLRQLAHQRRRSGPAHHSLNTTGLVHEAYLKLAGTPNIWSRDQHHFLALASRVMRNVLVDHARARHAAKRGGGLPELELQEDLWISSVDLDAVTELDDALRKLEAMEARQSRIVEHRYFGGLSLEEIAAVLDLSVTTVKRDLRSARAWLAVELGSEVAT